MKIYIVAPYEAMKFPIENLIKVYQDIEIEYGIGMLQDGLSLAKKAQKWGFDAIISRGGTAKLIKRNINLPTIDMKLSGNDILKVLLMAKNSRLNTALVGYGNIIEGAKEIIELLNLDIKIFEITDEDKITEELIRIKDNGIEQIIGDIVAIKKASELNFNTILCQSSEKTIKNALEDTIDFLKQISKNVNNDSILSGFYRKQLNDYIILKDNNIVKKSFQNYNHIPVSYEYLLGIKYDFDKSNNKLGVYFSEDGKIRIKITKLLQNDSIYYLAQFSKFLMINNVIKGVKEFENNSFYKIVINSAAITSTLDQIKMALKDEKIINIIGNDNYTSKSIITYFSSIESNNKKSIIIDLNIFEINNLNKMNLETYGLVIFDNANNIKDFNLYYKYLEKISNHTFIISRNIGEGILENENIIPIIIPNLNERNIDIYETLNNSVKFYHDKGMQPIVLDKDFNKNIDDFYDNSFTDLISVIKLCSVNYRGNVINNKIFKQYYYLSKNQTIHNLNTNIKLEQLETEYIKKVLIEENYNQVKASKRLGISRSTLWRKMKKNEL